MILTVLLGCEPAASPGEVYTVEVSGAVEYLFEGDTLQLEVALLDRDGAPVQAEVEWNSDAETVATVDDGLVTVVGKGLALISAQTPNGGWGTAGVTVVHRWETLSLAGDALCGLEEGAAVCWGESDDGVLGTDNVSSIALPGWPMASGPFQAIRLESYWGCALAEDGAPWCWGSLDGAEFTPATALTTSEPLVVLGLSCGLTAEGDLWAWGWDGESFRTEAEPVFTGLGLETLSGTYANGCGVDADGTGWCWGSGPALGNGTGEDQATPGQVIGDTVWSQLVHGGYAACGIDTEGAGYCWGHQAGQLGIGTAMGTDIATPTRLDIEVPLRSIALGATHTCAVDVEGGTWCWGENGSGQLGRDDGEPVYLPVLIDTVPPLVDVWVSARTSCGLAPDGAAYCWGHLRGGPELVGARM